MDIKDKTKASFRPIDEIRQDCLAITEKIVGIKGKEVRSESDRDELADLRMDFQLLNLEYEVAERAEQADKRAEFLGGLGQEGGPRGNAAQVAQLEARSIGEAFTEMREFSDWAERHDNGGTLALEVRTLLTSVGNWLAAPDTTSPGVGLLRPIGTPQFYGAPYLRPQMFVRDILPSAQTTLSIVPYIKESNFLTNVAGATVVAEGATKPELELDFTTDEAFIRKIAAWVPATWEILQDAPLLRGYIDQFLELALRYREDRELLSGSGTGVHIKGLLNQSGLQTATFTNDFWTTSGQAMGLLENVQGNASWCVMNPLDFWQQQTQRYTSFFQNQATNNPAPIGEPWGTVWGSPVIRTNAMARGAALIGDRRGALILDREGITVRVGDQHSTYFVENKVVILAEERLGLVVPRPDFFVQVPLS